MRALVVAVVTALALLPGSVGGANAAPPTLNPGSEPGSAREKDLVTTAAEEILASTAKGVAIAIVKPGMGPDFAVTTTYYFGEADVAAHRLVGPATQFEIASETKTYTGALLAQALAAGLVQLDDPVSKWVPAPHTVPSLDGAVITLRDLATHRSGLADDPPNLGNKADYTVEKLREGLDNAQLLSKPGSTWLYSDWGYGLLGTVLANIFMPNQPQPPFGPVVTENLTAPLGLDSTLLEIPTPDRAVGYNENGPAPYWNNTAALAGGGGLLSNANDMADWCRATLGIGLDPLAFLLPTELLPLAEGEDNKDGMGMAWQLYPNAVDFPVPYAYKNGGSSGFSSATFLVPSTKWAITVLSNGHDDEAVSTAARKVMTELAREPALPGTGSSFGS